MAKLSRTRRLIWFAIIPIYLSITIMIFHHYRDENIIEPPYEKPFKTTKLISTQECQNIIFIELKDNDQFHASISSDVYVFNPIQFSGYYTMSNNYLSLQELSGNGITLEKSDLGLFVPTHLTLEEALGAGWVLQILEN